LRERRFLRGDILARDMPERELAVQDIERVALNPDDFLGRGDLAAQPCLANCRGDQAGGQRQICG
jgi:hypothetical protein